MPLGLCLDRPGGTEAPSAHAWTCCRRNLLVVQGSRGAQARRGMYLQRPRATSSLLHRLADGREGASMSGTVEFQHLTICVRGENSWIHSVAMHALFPLSYPIPSLISL